MEFHQKNFKTIFPNSVTMLGLAFGVSSMNMAYWGQWEKALLFIVLAAIFDFLDGKVARLLGVSSKFGMQLDSLSDFISFGVAPGFLMYQWTLDPHMKIEVMENIAKRSEAVGIGWGIVLFLTMCSAMRLARFNIMSEEKTPEYWKNFFVGVPAPAGAGLATFPLMLALATHNQYDFFRSSSFVGFFLIFSGIMMASKIPTVSFKHIHVSESMAKILSMLRVAILAVIAGLVCMPWKVLSVICFLYIVTIPVGAFFFLKIKKRCLEGPSEEVTDMAESNRSPLPSETFTDNRDATENATEQAENEKLPVSKNAKKE